MNILTNQHIFVCYLWSFSLRIVFREEKEAWKSEVRACLACTSAHLQHQEEKIEQHQL